MFESLPNWLTSKRIWGAVLAVFGYLSQPEVFAILPEKVAAVVSGIGTLLVVFGIRSQQQRTETKIDENTALTAIAAENGTGKKGASK